MNWIRASERLPKTNGYYFVKSRYGQMSCFFDTSRQAFSHKWNNEFDNVEWLDETNEAIEGDILKRVLNYLIDYRNTMIGKPHDITDLIQTLQNKLSGNEAGVNK